MIFFRVIQAVGGGLIYPVTMTIVYHNFSRGERYRAMSIWGLSAMVAPAIGPTLSGYIVEYWDWRLIFTINIPIGIAGYLLAALILKETVQQRHGKFDLAGFITVSVGLFCLLLALNKGTDEGWTSAYIITLLYIAFASFALFIPIELSQESPIIDLSVFKVWNFTFSSFVLFIGTIGLYGGLFMVPLFMENVRDYSTMQTGLLLLPAGLISGIMMPIAVKIAKRIGPKPVLLTGIVILGTTSLPFTSLDMDTGYNTILMVMVLRGIGLGLFLMTATTMGMNALPVTKLSRAVSIKAVIRQVAGSFGIAILSTVIQNRQAYHLAHAAEYMNITSYPMKQALVSYENILWMAKEPAGAIKHILTYRDFLYAQSGFAPGIIQTKALTMINAVVQTQVMIFTFDDAFVVLAFICFCGIIPASLLKIKKGLRPRDIQK